MSMYRWRTALIALCATAGVATASQWQEARAVPTTLTVQGHLSADGGASVTGDYTIVLALYSSRTAPTAFWEESNVVTVVNGLFDARIGADTLNPITVEDFSDNTEVWIGITVIEGPGVPDGGEAELPRRRLGSTGYAFAAGYAETADSATRATSADSATTAETAARATTADAASAVSCSGCITVNHLGFDPATQVELQNALAALNIPTTVNGLGGGTISSNVTVSGSVTATSFSLAGGQSICDSSGNCGATLKSLNCVAPNDTPVYNHSSSAWECGTRNADGGVTATDLNCSGCVSESELDFEVVTDAELAAALAAYATTASLSDYTTSDALNAALAGYATTTALNAALANYATTDSLNAALANYATTDALSTALANYATKDSLNAYATTASLADYATTAMLNGYATTAMLDSYATTASLAAYATDAEVASTLENYTSLAALATALGDYATVADVASALANYATTADLAAYAKLTDLDDFALKTDVPTSVDGMGGGSISGSVTATGTIEGNVVRQNGNVVCDASGNCGPTLGSLNCAEGQTLRFNGTSNRWECGASSSGGSDPGINCTGDYKVLQWDGDAWICRDLRKTGLSSGEANGWEIVDNWGDAWDAIERPPLAWQDALDTCVAEGGRLPTATELWRNRASTGGTGNFADVTANRHLWTYNYDYTNGNHDTVRLSDGNIGANTPATLNSFRCIWPHHSSEAFDASNCFGPPGSECKPHARAFNVDRYSRPALDAVSAAWECRFHNASLMSTRDFQEIAQGQGFDFNEPVMHWTSDFAYWYSAGYGHHTAMTAQGQNVNWGYDNGQNGWGKEGAVSAASTVQRFRCIGRKNTEIGILPTPSCIDDECFTLSRRNGTIVADAKDRAALKRQEAVASCRAVGGYLPTTVEFFDLVQSGWANGSDNWSWLNESEYFHSNAHYYGIGKWLGTGVQSYPMINTSITGSDEDSARVYRCIWHERFEDEMTDCETDQNQMWTGTQYECVDAVDGDVDAQTSWPAGAAAFADAWGNKWDFFQRNETMDYPTAKALCEDLGGRLPTTSELWRVRYQQGVVGSELGQSTDTSWLWTLTPSAAPNYAMIFRLGTGVVDHAITTNTATKNYVRCIWPSTQGDALDDRGCYGVPADGGCFELPERGLRMDAYDRAAIYQPSAAWECAMLGGRLPTVAEYEELIQAGLPNGTGNWLHVSSPVYFYNGGYGTELARFRAADDGAKWAWSTGVAALANYQTGSYQWETSKNYFRCVYSNQLD